MKFLVAVLVALGASPSSARLSATHRFSRDGAELKSLSGSFSRDVELLGLRASLLARVDARAPSEKVSFQLHGELPRGMSWLSYDVVHRPDCGQTAYKLTASAFGARLVAATPFVPGGPPSYMNELPSLTEASAARTVGPVDLSGTVKLKQRIASLGLATRLWRGKLDADVTLRADGGAAECELGYGVPISSGRAVRVSVDTHQTVLEYRDVMLERALSTGALWVASAAVGYSDPLRPKLSFVRRFVF